MNKKSLKFLIGSVIYILTLGLLIPILVSVFDLFGQIYDYFADLAYAGVFFFIYLIGTFFFFPFIYSTLVKGKLSFNIERKNKKQKNPRYYAFILFLIGLPILIWLILGNLGYYSIKEVSGGLGEFALNGFLVSLIVLLYFCICPALILGLK
ncbi:MAG: hypothetical protein ACXAC5_12155 [Promethearchaeota archaeon]|jgi:MFS family permease